jgi:purine-binding chemotaxis protein CheW
MASIMNSYLTLKIGEEIFGVNVAKVMEIREYQPPKPLPQTFPFVLGVIEYRDEIVPLIDTAVKFGMSPIAIAPGTCIVILQLISDSLGKTYRIGVLVDTVADVLECEEAQMKTIVDDYKPNYIYSTFSTDDKLVFILNADVVFNQKEIIGMLDTINKLKKEVS